MICYIYTLSDPRTNQVRYVGKTIDPKERYRGHKKDKKGNTYRVNWIMSLKKQSLVPIFEVIDVVDCKEWTFWENYWIAQFKTWGFKLVNGNAKGDGCITFKHTEQAKEKISKTSKGRLHTAETKKLMSQNRIGIQFSENHLKNLSLSHLNQKNEHFYKSVHQINKITDQIINTYISIAEAERNTVAHNNAITMCCKGKRKTAGGFKWKYAA